MTTNPNDAPGSARATLGLMALFLLALALRVYDLDARALNHPEVYVPGIDLPDWMNAPRERTDLAGTLRATSRDGHPPTWFLGMLAWVQVFGASLWSLRFPSALAGAVSVVLMFLVSRPMIGASRAWLAALLFALHGFHVYWSQVARMYVVTGTLCLASVWLLGMLEERVRRSRVVAYVACTSLALWTQLYAWPLVFGQMVVGFVRSAATGAHWRSLRSQLLSVLMASPMISLAIYQNPPTRFHQPAWEYLQLGNLFTKTVFFWTPRPAVTGWAMLTVGLTLWLFLAGVLRGSRTNPRHPAPPEHEDSSGESGIGVPVLVAGAIGASAIMLAFGWYAPVRPTADRTGFYVAATFPLAVLALGLVLERGIGVLRRRPVAPSWNPCPDAILALVPWLCVSLVSAARGIYVARGTVVFVPFLLLAVVRGIPERRAVFAGVATLLAGISLGSLLYGYTAQTGPIDYERLADGIQAHREEADLFLVQDDYRLAPLYYYLPGAVPRTVRALFDRRILEAGEEALRTRPQRLWIVGFLADRYHAPLRSRVIASGYEPVRTVRALGGAAVLFARSTPGRAPDQLAGSSASATTSTCSVCGSMSNGRTRVVR